MKNFEKVLSKTFEKGLSNDGYGAPYPDTPSRGVTREGYAQHTLYRIKRGVAKTLGKFYQTRGMQSIPQHRVKRGVALRTHAAGVRTS